MMGSPTRWLFRVLFRVMAYRVPRLDVPERGVMLDDVIVINPGAGRVRCSLGVAGDRMEQLIPRPLDTPAMTGHSLHAGCFVLPGLIDMHVHIPPPARELVNVLFLAHGVTTVREAGDADGTTWGARERIQAGAVIGPRILASGPVLDGDPPFLPTSWPVSCAEDARRAVAALHRRGADFIKIHHTFP